MNRDLEDEIDPEDVDVGIDDSGTKLAPINGAIGGRAMKKAAYAINGEEEVDENFEMESAPGMFDHGEGTVDPTHVKIGMASANADQSALGNKSFAKTGSIGSMIAPVIDVDVGLQSNFATVYNNDKNDQPQEEPNCNPL